jgi:hypothetical protein
MLLWTSACARANTATSAALSPLPGGAQAISFLGDTLREFPLAAATRTRYEAQLAQARSALLESGRTTIISFAPRAKAPSIVCGTWISCDHCAAPIE